MLVEGNGSGPTNAGQQPSHNPLVRIAARERGTYVWTDDNLSTTYLFDALSTEDLDLLRTYRNYGRVCCIKGFDARSFAFNTRAAPDDYNRQFEILRASSVWNSTFMVT